MIPATPITLEGWKCWQKTPDVEFQYYASMALQQKEEMFFTINWQEDIKPLSNFIGYKGVICNITRIDTFEG